MNQAEAIQAVLTLIKKAEKTHTSSRPISLIDISEAKQAVKVLVEGLARKVQFTVPPRE